MTTQTETVFGRPPQVIQTREGLAELREQTARWFINISYRDKIEDQYPVEVLERTDDTLTVRFLSTGSVSIFDHAMIRELPFCKNARRLSRAEATAHWAKPPNYSGASRGYSA